MQRNDLIVQNILSSNDIIPLSEPGLHTELATYINNLILENFDQLISLLYRLDVSEQKLKILLKENSEADAGKLIATLIIERQIQKIKSRQEHQRDKNMMDDEEKW